MPLESISDLDPGSAGFGGASSAVAGNLPAAGWAPRFDLALNPAAATLGELEPALQSEARASHPAHC